jgi:Mn2+/Fe2+ NRAMP family transporter
LCLPYNLFLHSSAVKEKWSRKSHLKEVKKDLILAVCLGGVISMSIIITSAVTFFDKGIPLDKGVQLAHQLKPLFKSFAKILFGIGFFAAGLSSAITAPYAAAFASSGVLGWKSGQNSKGFRFVWLGVILVGLIVSLFNFNPISVIIFAQVANGLVLPVASAFLLIMLNNRKKMGDLANTLWQNIFGSVIILIVSVLGIWNIVRLFVRG